MSENSVYMVSGLRTPVGRYGGALATIRPDDLAALAIKAVVEDSGLDPARVDEVTLGNANGAGEENRNVARMAWLLNDYPDTVPGMTINRLCASGMSSISTAAALIQSGQADIVVAGGVESMSRAPWVTENPPRPSAAPGNPSTPRSAGDSSIPSFRPRRIPPCPCPKPLRKLPVSARSPGNGLMSLPLSPSTGRHRPFLKAASPRRSSLYR